MKTAGTHIRLIILSFVIAHSITNAIAQDLVIYADSTILRGEIIPGTGPLTIVVDGKTRRIDRRLVRWEVRKIDKYTAKFLLTDRKEVEGFLYCVEEDAVLTLIPNPAMDSIRQVRFKFNQLKGITLHKNPGKGGRIGAIVGLTVAGVIFLTAKENHEPTNNQGGLMSKFEIVDPGVAKGMVAMTAIVGGALIGSAIGSVERRLDLHSDIKAFKRRKDLLIRHSILKLSHRSDVENAIVNSANPR